MANRLANETSPYLLQHKDNPVDWLPWGDEAFALARETDRPILLSVGYSSCHWCHVMAHESFEDEATARLMNEWFVNVKVDREERPDVDGVYMMAVQTLTGRGGWPMTVFMTADGQPFYAGTYFPPSDGHGLPSFQRVLEALHRAWIEERPRILASAEGVTEHLTATSKRGNAEGGFEPTRELLDTAVRHFQETFDATWGGFGQAPKFPSPSNLEFLLTHHAVSAREGRDDGGALDMVLHTLRAMASGGMYDQLGGGFARYSVDHRWLIPHFEKMLYDNAQLVRLYLHAWQLTKDPLFERIIRETLGYLEREMRDPAGGFRSALDADSEGIEGKYFVWTRDQITQVLGEDARIFCEAHEITAEGNFHDPHHPDLVGRNVVSRRYDLQKTAERFDIDAGVFEAKMEEGRRKLFSVRMMRVPPGLDDKVLCSWNGLALAAFAEAGRVLQDSWLVSAAEEVGAFIRTTFWREGRLLHTYRSGEARIDGMVEDYAYAGLGFLELYKTTGDWAHVEFARELYSVLLADFRDLERGGFFETSHSGEALIIRQKALFDEATPSGNGAAAQLGYWLSRYFDNEEWTTPVIETLALARDFLAQAPNGFGSLMQVVELLLARREEVVVVGGITAREELMAELADRFLPAVVIAPASEPLPRVPLFAGRESAGSAQAYVCENMACQLPVSTRDELRTQLAGGLS